MTQPAPLAQVFRAHLRVQVGMPPGDLALERMLAEAVSTGRKAWPEVALPEEQLVQHLAERIDPSQAGTPLEEVLRDLSLSELYLTCACAGELPQAIEAFEASYLSRLPAQLSSLREPPSTIQELCQKVRVHLLVKTPEAGIRLGSYAGRGTLMSWVRIGAIRQLLKDRGNDRPSAAKEDEAAEQGLITAPGLDPEMDLIRRRYEVEFRQAISASFSALAPEERYLLRLHFVDRLSTTELGGLFRVNQSTISRRLKAVRKTVYENTKHDLQARLGLSTRDFKSFMAILDSQLNLSISQLFLQRDSPGSSDEP